MEKEVCISLFLIIYLSGCSYQSTDTTANEHVSIEIIDLNKRVCKSNAFDEIELDFILNLTDEHKENYYGLGSGLAVNDIDNDGLIDIFLANFDSKSSIFWNKGNLIFEKENFPLGNARSVNLVDYDGDGRLDLFITVFNATPVLYENKLINGKIIFKKTNFQFMKYAFSSDWADVDMDGDLDIVVASYSKELFRNINLSKQEVNKYGVRILINNKDSFEEIQLNNQSEALVALFYDINDDGFPDVIVGNDFLQLGDFIYLCDDSGCQNKNILDVTATNTMSYDFGDIENDGDQDIFSSDMLFYEPELSDKIVKMHLKKNHTVINKARLSENSRQTDRNVLQINNNMEFIEDAEERGVSATGWSWSSKFADINNDGFLDLYVVNGMVENQQVKDLIGKELIEENFMFINDGNGYFINNKFLGLNSTKGGRGMSFADLDNDGDLDIIINNVLSKASIFVNNECKNDFIEFELLQKGTENVYSIGGKVVLNTSLGILSRTVKISSGYLSGDSYRLHFGLGKNAIIYNAKVIWPDGKISNLSNLSKNNIIRIKR